MADLELGMVITADGSDAAAEGAQFENTLDGIAASERRAGAASDDLAAKTTKLSAEERKLRNEIAALRAELDPVGEAQRRVATATDLANTAFARGAINADQHALALKRAQLAANGHITSMGQQRAAAFNLNQQFQDLTMGAMMGVNPLTLLAQQGGQTATAIQQLTGKTTGLVGVMAGPWGSVILLVGVLLGNLIPKLVDFGNKVDDNAKSLENAAQSADSFGNAQSALGKIIDLTTGKLKTQNAVLIQTIKLQAQANILKAQADQKAAREALGGLARPGFLENAGTSAAGIGSVTAGSANLRGAQASADSLARKLGPLKTALQGYIDLSRNPNATTEQLNAGLDQTIKNLDTLAASGRLAGRDLISTKKAVLDLGVALNDERANKLVADAASGKPLDPLLKPYARDKTPPKPKSTSGVEEFGSDAADKIADIVGQFSDIPPAVRQAEKTIRDLDDLIEDLGEKKPPDFGTLIASAEKAKQVVQSGLLRTLASSFEAPETLAKKAADALKQIDAIMTRLRAEEPPGFKELLADAERAKGVIQEGLTRPYTDFVEQQEQALAINGLMVRGQEDEAAALRIIIGLEKDRVPLTTAQKDAVLATVQALKAQQRELDVLRDKQRKYLAAIGDVRGALTGALTGSAEDIKALPGRLVSAFNNLRGEVIFEKLFGEAFRDLEDQVNGTNVVREASDRMAAAVEKAKGSIIDLGNAARVAAGNLTGAGSLDPTSAEALGNDEIVVTGSRIPKDPAGFFSYTIEKLGKGVLGENAAKTIGKFAGKGLEGAATGQVVAGIGKALGIKMSSTGAQLGGAVGSFLPIPGGQIIGSIAGGLIGNLFNKPKYGTASLTSNDRAATLGGNSGSVKSAAGTLAGAVQGGIAQIAEQLGGQLGNYKVSIGTFDGKYRVSTTGFTGSLDSKKAKGQGLVDFGKDGADAAIAFAIRDAILDGAVQGLSAAMQKALRDNADIDKAVREALKVKEVEQLIGGLGSSLKKIFSDFDATAAERVRVAKAYGLDVLAVEKINAEQRATLVEETLKGRIGGLKDFLDSIKFGDLFEGTATERRSSLLEAISSAQKDAEAGKDGAADRLAQLQAQLLQSTRDSFGTAGGEYTTDRTNSISAAQRVIELENQRVREAAGLQQATATAVQQTATLTAETNTILARVEAGVLNVAGALEALSRYMAGNDVIDYGSTARKSVIM